MFKLKMIVIWDKIETLTYFLNQFVIIFTGFNKIQLNYKKTIKSQVKVDSIWVWNVSSKVYKQFLGEKYVSTYHPNRKHHLIQNYKKF